MHARAGQNKFISSLILLHAVTLVVAIGFRFCYVQVMSVTGASVHRELILAEVAKLTSSEILKSSESLCRLLKYLAEQAISHSGLPIKEYQIATEVFGRPSDFDARLDSTVRVQTGRLRSKLAEYYASEGNASPVIIDLPRGSYTLTIHDRPEPEPPSVALVAGPAQTPPADLPATVRQAAMLAWIFGLIAVGLIAMVVYLLLTRTAPADQKRAEQAPQIFLDFWGRFINRPEQPWVIFSNAEFVGRPDTGMRYYDPARDSKNMILDHYTGVGEVLAIHELDGLFASLRRGIRVKRGRLLSLDDTESNNLIFVGSPSENLTLREIPATQEFIFRQNDRNPRKGDVRIENAHPMPGEAAVFLASPGPPIVEDYAVIALVPGMNPNRSVMILAGTTTIGTQAAVEFVCRAKNLDQLAAKVGKSRNGDFHLFEAVIKVRVSGGVPMNSQLVAVHPRTAN